MAELAHSKWSASKFEADMLCPGKHVMERDTENTTSKHAAEGTAAHQVLTWALQDEAPASAYIGRVIDVDSYSFEVDNDMAGHVQVCIDYTHDVAGDDGVIFADIRVNYSSYLGVPEADAWGTADVIVARGDELIVIDFKYGQGVEVSAGYDVFGAEEFDLPDGIRPRVAKPNPQMSLYALGALQAYQGLVADFERVRLVISQPRIKKAPSEYDMTVDELEGWASATARNAVLSCQTAGNAFGQVLDWDDKYLAPGEKQCKFCRAKATCSKLRNEVAEAVFGIDVASPNEFADLPAVMPSSGTDSEQWLAACMSKVDLIADWCKAVQAETERRLFAGDNVPGYKLVQGKRGARQWANVDDAEKTLKSFRLKIEEMYDFKLISPTSAEKLAKAETIGKRQWPKLQGLIVQSEGKPHVAPATDPRPAIEVKPVVEDFDDESLA